MKLILYSDGFTRTNKKLDLELLKLTKKESPKMTYIPCSYYEHEKYYEEWVTYYLKYGVTNFNYFAIDRKFERSDLKKAFNSDIIYLSGGNTYYFLKHLRNSGLIPQFKSFVQKGGVLAGMSAGAILLTPTIGTAAIPSLDRDKNDVKVKKLDGMKFVNFEFSPHYEFREKGDRELARYSAEKSFPIFGVADGGGLSVEGDRIKFFGKVVKFQDGKKESVTSKWMRL